MSKWLINNKLSEDYGKMPKSIRRKTEGVSYPRERYLAKEYIKHINSRQLDEAPKIMRPPPSFSKIEVGAKSLTEPTYIKDPEIVKKYSFCSWVGSVLKKRAHY